MTTAIALTGQWAGLRAFPRGFRTPDTRQRMEAAVERLQDHRERFLRHVTRAEAAIRRIDVICADAIARLDLIDGDADLEPSLGSGDGDDREGDCCDQGEPSLSSLDRYPVNQCGSRWIGGVSASDSEGEHDGREPEDFL